MSSDALASPVSTRRYSLAAILAAGVLAGLLMFLPLVVIGGYVTSPDSVRFGGDAEAAVGIAVIARGLFRFGMQSLLRTSLGAFTRTAARTATRRATRLAVRQLTMLTIASLLRGGAELPRDAERPVQNTFFALAAGAVGLWASFRVILALLAPEQAAAVLQGMPPWLGAALVAAPLAVYAAVTCLVAPLYGVRATFRTQLDGLLLQGYFTGAASFLPLTTDVDYQGSESAKARTAATSLLTLLALHLAASAAGRALEAYPVQFAAAALLMYAFVFSFPLPPLEGHHLWRRSKLLWLAIWLPILIAFVANIPEAFTAIL